MNDPLDKLLALAFSVFAGYDLAHALLAQASATSHYVYAGLELTFAALLLFLPKGSK